jgi:hypothetical protein
LGEGDTLYYIGMGAPRSTFGLGTVDEEFSRRLNREMNVPLHGRQTL